MVPSTSPTINHHSSSSSTTNIPPPPSLRTTKLKHHVAASWSPCHHACTHPMHASRSAYIHPPTFPYLYGVGGYGICLLHPYDLFVRSFVRFFASQLVCLPVSLPPCLPTSQPRFDIVIRDFVKSLYDVLCIRPIPNLNENQPNPTT